MRKAIIGVGIFIILIVVAGLLAPSFIDVNHYRPQIESKLRDRLGRNVSLGPMRLSLIPLGFRVQNAVIADDAKFNTNRPFAQVQTLSVRPEILPLLHHDIVIKSVQLDRPTVELIPRGAVTQTPFDGQFELTGASLSGLQRFLNVQALANSDAVITGRADVKNNAGAVASTGKFDIQNPRVRGVDIGYPIAIDY